MATEDLRSPLPIKFPLSTILTVLGTLVAVKMLTVVSPLLMPLLLASLLAISLYPSVMLLNRWGCPRNLAVMAITVVWIIILTGIGLVIVPKLYQEANAFMEGLPELRQNILNQVDGQNPVYGLVTRALNQENWTPKLGDLKQLWGAGNMVLGGFAEIFLIFIFTVYLLLDGPRLIQWCVAFFAPSTRNKIARTGDEMAKIISAYVVGQLITSFISFLFVLGSLSLLQVPSVLLLATLAGLLDVLPVLGFVIAVVPAMLFALNVSPATALIVLALYLFYHAIENYVIVPLVYGNQLRVSSFVVFFSLLAAGLWAGIEGAIAILPIVASYPIVERIWLRRYVRKETLSTHAALEQAGQRA